VIADLVRLKGDLGLRLRNNFDGLNALSRAGFLLVLSSITAIGFNGLLLLEVTIVSAFGIVGADAEARLLTLLPLLLKRLANFLLNEKNLLGENIEELFKFIDGLSSDDISLETDLALCGILTQIR
jgi:hypothetical protein